MDPPSFGIPIPVALSRTPSARGLHVHIARDSPRMLKPGEIWRCGHVCSQRTMKEALVSSPTHDMAFRSVFDMYEPAIRAYCLRRLPVSYADDAVAETFLTVWRKRDQAPAGDEQRLWLYGIARNIVRNARRSAERSQRLTRRIAREPRTHQEGPEVVVVRSSARSCFFARGRDCQVVRSRRSWI